MNKISLEKLNDWVINLYMQWIFIRSFEKSAIILSKITWYRLCVNVDKKTWFIYLELGFPKDKLEEILKELDWIHIRVIDNKWNVEETIWVKKEEVTEEQLLEIKKDLVKFY